MGAHHRIVIELDETNQIIRLTADAKIEALVRRGTSSRTEEGHIGRYTSEERPEYVREAFERLDRCSIRAEQILREKLPPSDVVEEICHVPYRFGDK